MFKLFVKLMLFMLVMALAGPFVMRGSDGRPMLSLDDLKLPEFKLSLPKFGREDPVATEGPASAEGQQWIQWSEKTTNLNPEFLTRDQLALLDLKAQDNIFYRWQDKHGIWQFSATPNRNTLNYVVRTDPNANVLQSMTTEEIDRVFGRNQNTNENSITKDNPLANGKGLEGGMLPLPTTVPITEIPKLIDQAKDVQKIMEQRMKQIDQQIK